jgi:hypothetical protein
MPRPKSANVVQVAFKIPEEWVKRFDSLTKSWGKDAVVTSTFNRTHLMRAAMRLGLQEIERLNRLDGRVSAAYRKPRKTKT